MTEKRAAEKPGTPNRAPKTTDRDNRDSSNFWITLVVLIPAGLVVMPTTVLIALGMIPTLVAYVVDDDLNRTAPVTVGALNFCGVLPYVIELWHGPHTLTGAMAILADPVAWMVMYGAAGLGWAFHHVIPIGVANVEVNRAEAKINRLQEKRRRLIADWGTEALEDDGPGPAPADSPAKPVKE